MNCWINSENRLGDADESQNDGIIRMGGAGEIRFQGPNAFDADQIDIGQFVNADSVSNYFQWTFFVRINFVQIKF